ncbi:MAG: tetratricopeptide repeat protein [Polyangiaceae bacterium]|nr:tetratricopeptide repeat protein [Myxococcales bacterium]MCC6903020.1 tetratricopeptide repeat protein [Polyangiaceae bacterium]
MQRDRRANAETLLHDVGYALERGYPPRELIPMLEKLVVHAEKGSDAALFGMRELAKLLCDKQPWRAARLARQVLAEADDAEAWRTLGVALSMLGHFRAAVRAYQHALAHDPRCPVATHNLGHLLDVGLGRPDRGLRYLSVALDVAPHDIEIRASHAHALVRLGRVDEALASLGKHLPGGRDEARELVARFARG